MSLESLLEHLAEETAQLSIGALTDASDLAPEELARFARVWVKVSLERRQKFVDGLVELAEDNTELDFIGVFKVCLRDSHDVVREKAIVGLWEFEDRSLITLLVDLLNSDGSNRVRASAATALGKFASLAQDRKILSKDGEQVKTSLMKALSDRDEYTEVRRRALEAVAAYNTGDVHEYVQWAYRADSHELKCSSLYAMGRTGDNRWMPMLLKEMHSPIPALRYEAATACGELDDEESAPHLVPLLEDEDLQVQLAAIGSLGKIGGSLAKRALRRCMKNGDPTMEEAARVALEDIQGTEDHLGFG